MTTNAEATQTPDERIAQLAHERAERKDELDLPGTMTQRQVNDYVAHTALLDARIRAIRNATATVAALPDIGADQEWLDNLNTWRTLLCDELLALPARIHTRHEMGVQQNLTISIRMIDFGNREVDSTGYGLETLRLGALMRESGYVAAPQEGRIFGRLPWYGSIPEVEQRIQEKEKRRTDAQAALDDAMLSDTDRAQRDAESKIRRDALNALPMRKTRGDGSQYDKYADGRRVEVTD